MTQGRNHFHHKPLLLPWVLLLVFFFANDGLTSSRNCEPLVQHIENFYEVTLNKTQQNKICEVWSNGSDEHANIEDLQAEAEKYRGQLEETPKPKTEKEKIKEIESKLEDIQEEINRIGKKLPDLQEDRQKKLQEYKTELSDYFFIWYPGIKYHFCKDFSQLCNSIEINQKRVDDLMLKKAELIQQRENLEGRYGEDLRLARKRQELGLQYKRVQNQLDGMISLETRILEILKSTNPTNSLIATGESGILNSFQTKSRAAKSQPQSPAKDEAIGAIPIQ